MRARDARRIVFGLALAACGRLGFTPVESGDGGADGAVMSVFTRVALPPGGATLWVAIARDDSAWYVAGSNEGPWISRDHGASWVACGQHDSRALAVAPDRTVYLSASDDVYRSDDECATWQPTGLGVIPERLATAGARLFATTDIGVRVLDGTAWSIVPTPLEGTQVMAITADPTGTTLAAAGLGGGGAIVSSNGGATWTAASTGLSTSKISELAISASNPLRMVALEDAGPNFGVGATSRTDDGGQTWTNKFSLGGFSLAIDPSNQNHAIAGVFDDFVESADGFDTHATGLRTSEMALGQVEDLAFAPDGSVVAACDRGVFVSAPGPLAWQPRFNGLDAWSVRTIAVQGQNVYLGTTVGVLTASGGGAFGQPQTTGFTYDSSVVSLVAVNSTTLLASARTIQRSVDGGQTWMQVFDTNLDNFRVNTLELIGTRIYAGSKLRALVADPPYDTWTPHVIAAANHSVRDIVAGAANQIWFATDDGLFVTTDDANTFQPVTVGAGATKFIALARRDDGSIVAATDGGVWASDASGTTWRQLGLQGITINALLVRATTLVAATESGVFVTSDDGASWQSLPGLDTEHPRALALDPLTADLLVGTSGHGLWRTAQP